MALDARKMLEMLPELEEWLSAKAAEETMGDGPMREESEEDEGEGGPPAMSAPPDAGKGGGLGVVIEMAPKGAPRGGKVPGCPDCESGTPHQHMGR